MADPRVKVLYISGWQRSGSTILANLLGQLDGFFSTGELYYLWDYVWCRNILCGCGRPFKGCQLWAEVVRRAFGAETSIDAAGMREMALRVGRTRAFPRFMLPFAAGRIRAGLNPYVFNLQRLYGAIASTTGSTVLVDSSKWPSYGRVLAMVPGIDLRVLHIVRDPRAVAYSWLRRKLLPDRDPPEHMYRTPLDSSLRWNAWNVATEAFFGREPLRLRYEDFVRRPQASVKAILEFLGEGSRELPFLSERSIDLRTNHTVSGNPLRLRSGRVDLVEDDEWRSRMRWRDASLVTLLTMPLLYRYGYLPRTAARPSRPPERRAAPECGPRFPGAGRPFRRAEVAAATGPVPDRSKSLNPPRTASADL